MDKTTFIKEIKNIFLDINAKEKKYSRVWLSEANFGGLYRSGKYQVNVKPWHNSDNIDEGRNLIYMLHEKIDVETRRKYYYMAQIHNENEEIYTEPGDIVLINEEEVY